MAADLACFRSYVATYLQNQLEISEERFCESNKDVLTLLEAEREK